MTYRVPVGWFKVGTGLVGLLLVGLLVLSSNRGAPARSRNVVVIVDMEPDDRIALMLLAAQIPEEMVLIGTTGMHAGRKAALAATFLEQLGLASVPVIQGSGGEAGSYPEIASSRAAREYQFEGHGLLPDVELAAINRDLPRSSEKLSQEIRKFLQEYDELEIVLLAPATDLVLALEQESSLESRIKHIHLMGGWSQITQPSGEVVLRTTYNWNMDPVSAAKLMSMNTIPMSLYSSHLIKRSFSGGSINKDRYPEIINKLESQRAEVPAFDSFFVASESWDHHLLEKIPPLNAIIGNHAGRQFTPADPVVVVGMTRPDFVTETRRVDISIDLDDLDPARGFKVRVKDNPASRIRLVENVNSEVFRQQVLHDLQKISTLSE
jgi:inosine-uridine nucleoside N-ribohydrolase